MDKFDEAMEKTQAEKAYYAAQQQIGDTATTAHPYYGDTCNTQEESNRSRLRRRLFEGNAETQKIEKALRILEAHPEFEDFAWLVRSNLI